MRFLIFFVLEVLQYFNLFSIISIFQTHVFHMVNLNKKPRGYSIYIVGKEKDKLGLCPSLLSFPRVLFIFVFKKL